MEIVGRFEFGLKNYGNVVTDTDIYEIKEKNDSKNAIGGDTVKIKYTQDKNIVTDIIKRTTDIIPGVLYTSSRTIYGFNNRKVPMKKFIPNDKKYPMFLVPTKIPQNGVDTYVTINLNKWIEGEKYAIGSLCSVIGPIGRYDVELEYLKYCHHIKYKPFKKLNFIPDDYLHDITPDRIDLTNKYTISIDPVGCRDIDDALHIEQVSNKVYEIGIHIADVSSFIPYESFLDREIMKRGETVYLEQEQINMLPDEFSFDHCSLLQDEKRRTFSLIINIDIDGKINSYEFVKGIISNKLSISYEEATKLLNINNDITNLYKIGRILYEGTEYDMHKMVEIYMILANRLVAEFISKHDKENSIFRTLSAKNSIIVTDQIKILNIFNMNRAEYVNYENNKGHCLLNLEYYTHFTSPIRRYIDIIIHRILYNILTGKKKSINPKMLCHYLNRCQNNIKKACNDSIKLEIIHKFTPTELSGIIASIIVVQDNKLLIYVEKFKLLVSLKLFSNKIKHLVKYISTEEYIEIYLAEKKIIFNVCSRILINMIILKKSPHIDKKIVVELVDDNLKDMVNILSMTVK